MSDKRYLMDLTTAVAPAEMFTVDGTEYRILSIDHFSPSDEAGIMSLFARYAYITGVFEKESDRQKAEKIAVEMRDLRIEMLTRITDMPADVAGKLPLSSQHLLIKHMEDDMEEKGLTEKKEDAEDAS